MKSPFPTPSLSRKDRRLREKEGRAGWERVLDRRAAARASGAGFHVDEELREFLDLFNSRLDENVADPAMPFSFGILEPFVTLRDDGPFKSYDLLPERDHAYSVADFVEFVEARRCADAGRSRLQDLPEGVIHSFTALGDIRDHAFEDSDGQAFATSGMTFVRTGERLHWMMIGGTVCDLGARTATLQAWYREMHESGQISFTGSRTLDFGDLHAAALEGVDGVWKTLAYGIFDLGRMVHQSRTFARDEGPSRTAVSDDPASLGIDDIEAATQDQIEGMKAFAARVNEHAIVFDVAETLFQLPAYFAYRVSLVREVHRRTRAGLGRGADAGRVLRAPRDARTGIRRVETLEIVNAAAEKRTRTFTPPRFAQELDGFWRALGPGRIGKNRDGEPEMGRTWVSGHVRWRDKPRRTGVVTVKAPVQAALDRAEQLKAEGGVLSMTIES